MMRPEWRMPWQVRWILVVLLTGCGFGPQAPVAPCLDCMVPDGEPDEGDGAGRWRFFFAHDPGRRDDCRQRNDELLNGGLPGGGFGDGFVMLVSAGLVFAEGETVWQHDRPLRLVEGNRWAVDVVADDITDVLRVELRGECNGRDDDCDLDVDEGAVPRLRTCGQGACMQTVVAACAEDCRPLPTAADEICDGIDNDCDGATDEGLPIQAVTCGLGPCLADGMRACVDGAWVDDCQPLPDDAPEVCDGIDNDCDGDIDDLGPCYEGPAGTEGVGVCAGGTLRCDLQTGDRTCDGQVTPRVEDTNNPWERVDDDCDGELDEADYLCPDCGAELSISVDDAPLGAQRVIVRLDRPDEVMDRPADIEAQQQAVIAEIAGFAAENGNLFTVLTRYEQVYALSVEADASAIGRLVRHPRVAGVYADLPLSAALTASTDLVGASAARAQLEADGAGVRVAVFDTGVAHDHPTFGCAAVGAPGCPLIAAHDAVGPEPIEGDPHGHGTGVAAIIAGRGAPGVGVGVAPGAELVSVRVLDAEGQGWVSGLIGGLDWLLAHPEYGVRVIDLSVASARVFDRAGCAAYAGVWAPTLGELRSRGVLLVGAAGNSGDQTGVAFPACDPGVLAVGATYGTPIEGEQRWPVCSDGVGAAIAVDDVPCFVDGRYATPPHIGLLAPGAPITTASAEGVVTAAGTSHAAAMVAGAAAVLLSVAPEVSIEHVMRGLRSTAALIDEPGVTARRLDLAAAADVWPCAYVPPQIEARNGLDDDCDGAVDEEACERLDLRQVIPRCNAIEVGADFGACMADNAAECDPAMLQRWCTAVARDDLRGLLLGVLAEQPGCDQIDIDRGVGGDWLAYCARFAPGVCPDSSITITLAPLPGEEEAP